jgi:cytochrome c
MGLSIVALAAVAGLSACNKPASQPATGETNAASGPAGSLLSDEDAKKAQAALPAPYNTADLSNGQSKFALCSTCHTVVQGGPNMTGPNLHGVFGRRAGSVADFKYSDALKATGWTWDPAHVDTWITDPKTAVPGTKMTFAGLKDPKDRTDVIAYVMVQTGYKP